MANELKKDIYYIDEVGTLTSESQKPIIMAIMITPNANDSRVIIKESVDGMPVIDVRIASNETRYIEFDAMNGIEVTSEFEVDTLTSVDTVILFGNFKKIANTAR